MQIEAVRKILKSKIKNEFDSQAEYARKIDITANNLSLFLSASGAYRKRVPKKILEDLGLKTETSISYHKRVVI